MKKTLVKTYIISILAFSFLLGCEDPREAIQESESTSKPDTQKKPTTKQEKKIGVLLVNHGSHSKTWRQSLLDLESQVKTEILKDGSIQGLKTGFMEYNEPSIATRLKEFDKENFTDVIIVPIFLTVSPHSFDDIPTIIGAKEDPQSMEVLKIEKIERYTPKAKTHVTGLLDFEDILQKNLLRRVKKLSKDPKNEGMVLIAYGDVTYEKEWIALLNKIAKKVSVETGIDTHSHGWCGHIAHYDPAKTTKAIETVLSKKKKALVVPILVAHDETFQIKIIGDGIKAIPDSENRVTYVPDSILPDKNVEHWVIQSVRSNTKKIEEL